MNTLNYNFVYHLANRYGGRQAATFCALYTLHQELQNEDAVDVYKTITLYAAKRPGMFKSKVGQVFFSVFLLLFNDGVL